MSSSVGSPVLQMVPVRPRVFHKTAAKRLKPERTEASPPLLRHLTRCGTCRRACLSIPEHSPCSSGPSVVCPERGSLPGLHALSCPEPRPPGPSTPAQPHPPRPSSAPPSSPLLSPTLLTPASLSPGDWLLLFLSQPGCGAGTPSPYSLPSLLLPTPWVCLR